MRTFGLLLVVLIAFQTNRFAFAQDVQPDAQQIIGPVLDLMNRAIQQGIQQQQNTLTRNQVIIVQQLLTQRGFDVGPPDGVVGPKTMAVVAQLQTKAGVPVTGVPDKQLLDALLQGQ